MSRPFPPQIFWLVTEAKRVITGVPNDISDGSVLFKCPSKSWQRFAWSQHARTLELKQLHSFYCLHLCFPLLWHVTYDVFSVKKKTHSACQRAQYQDPCIGTDNWNEVIINVKTCVWSIHECELFVLPKYLPSLKYQSSQKTTCLHSSTLSPFSSPHILEFLNLILHWNRLSHATDGYEFSSVIKTLHRIKRLTF